jgi:aryl-alcohol dehydrogenase-like predicted oxidoreductase
VSAVGLGCMPLSNPPMRDRRDDALATVHAALDAGVTLLDTANIYAPAWDAMGHNEALVAEALESWSGSVSSREDVLVLTKGGIMRGRGETWERDASAEGLLAQAQESARQLRTSTLDLYLLHRPDPSISYRQQVRNLAQVASEGVADMIGLSNVSGDQLEVALDEVGGPDDGGIVAVQNEFSPRFRASPEVRDRCQELGIAFLPWSPLGGSAEAVVTGSTFAPFADLAESRGATPQQIVIAWHLASSPVAIPIPGSTRPASIISSVEAASIRLTDDEVALLDATAGEDVSQFPDDLPDPPLE